MDLAQAGAHSERASRSPSPDQLLANCALEDLAHIGAIQPYACVLVADPSSQIILACSKNVGRFLGKEPREVVGQHLATLLGQNVAGSTLFISAEEDFALTLPGVHELPGGPHYVSISARSGTMLVELEPVVPSSLTVMQRQQILHRSYRTSGKSSVSEIVAEYADRFIEVAPFDRVMVYQFLDDWSGQVICERGSIFETSMLGLHFPASDIPAQARKLYQTSGSRLIADTQAQPVPMVGLRATTPNTTDPSADGEDLVLTYDLSNARSRACSKVHILYLENIGARASFSCSIMFRGQLWGLIACHHKTPIALDLQVRLDCERIARSVSVELMRVHAERKMQMIENFRLGAASLIEILPENIEHPKDFSPCAEGLCRLLDADGLAIVKGPEIFSIGTVPTDDEVANIAEIIFSKSEGRSFKTNCLASIYPKALTYAKDVAGLLTMSTSNLTSLQPADHLFIWFRREFLATVHWAGRPEKNDTAIYLTNGTQVLSPRSSFEVWAEERKNSCRPWTSEQIFKANLWVHNYMRKRNMARVVSSEDLDGLPFR